MYIEGVMDNNREDHLEEQGRRVREIIERENLSQADFSSITGIKTSTLNHVITGRNNISPTVMRQILSAFPKYNEEWIRTGLGEVYSSRDSENNTLHLRSIQSSTNGNNGPATLFSTSSSRTYNDSNINNSSLTLSPHDVNEVETTTASQYVKRSISKIIVYYTDNTFETFILDK